MEKITIYILTHKKFDYEENEIYKPLLNGSALLNDDFGYIRDDTGENISKLNPYYAELTGQYWAWKNSTSDIIGFCHYRRYFAKGIFLKKLEKKDIQKILKKYDIIVPQRVNLNIKNINGIGNINQTKRIMANTASIAIHTKEDYYLVRDIIKEKSPEYLQSYDTMLNSKYVYLFNMFITKKEILDDYFNWLFMILNEVEKQTNFSKYTSNNKRLLGYISERLLQVYIEKNNLKVKEEYILHNELRVPNAVIIQYKFPKMHKLFNKILDIEYYLKNRK